jgi:hypothetical protein
MVYTSLTLFDSPSLYHKIRFFLVFLRIYIKHYLIVLVSIMKSGFFSVLKDLYKIFRTGFRPTKGGRLIWLVRRGMRTGQALFPLRIEPGYVLERSSLSLEPKQVSIMKSGFFSVLKDLYKIEKYR